MAPRNSSPVRGHLASSPAPIHVKAKVAMKGHRRRKSKEGKFHAGRIVMDPEICHGKPTIRGTRIMVVNILSMLAGGATFQDIIEAYPHLTREDIQAATEYATKVVADEEVLFVKTSG